MCAWSTICRWVTILTASLFEMEMTFKRKKTRRGRAPLRIPVSLFSSSSPRQRRKLKLFGRLDNPQGNVYLFFRPGVEFSPRVREEEEDKKTIDEESLESSDEQKTRR